MTQEEFEDTLRKFLRQEPFRPFVVERMDGTFIWVNHCGIAVNGGGATVLNEWEMVEFLHDEVRSIRQVVPEAAT